jgi:integrase
MEKRILTEPFIRALKAAPPGERYAVSDALVPGLRVRVTDKGTKSFVLWRRVDRSAKSASALALGEVGRLTLADARAKARTWLVLIDAGRDPRDVERADRDATCGNAMEDFLRLRVKGQRKAKDVAREMRTELLPRWGGKPLTAITRRDVIRMVDEIKNRGAPAQARNVLGHARAFFNWAAEKDLLAVSPCVHIRAARLIGPKLPRQRVLTDAELRTLWRASGQLAYPIGPLVRMLALTGQRKSEVAEARWREFDLRKALWTIPPERFKSDATHIVPLSDAVMELLHELPRWVGGDFLFSTTGGRTPVNGFSKAKDKLDDAMGSPNPFVLHDIRRTVRTRLSELRVPDRVAEMVIGHGAKGLQRIYDQHQFVDEMREALTAWALRLGAIVGPREEHS